jgi:putative oxidoreductase
MMIDFRSLAGPAGVALVGRALMALLFILAGIAKVTDPTPVLNQMREFSVPTALFLPVVALEIGGGIALLLGLRVRDVAGALGIFCILAAFIFHHDLADKVERSIFFKDLAIAGGLLALAVRAALARPV